MRRLRLALGAVVLVVAGIAALEPGDVTAQTGAASIVETGWWSRQPTGTPGNAFEVARAPDGDVSVTALRIRVDGTITTAQLRLAEAQTAGSPSMQVCATTAPWTPATPGAWEQRPTPTCGATPVRLVHDEVQRVYTADLASFLAGGGTVSVMVVPAPDESITVPPPTPEPPVDVPVAPPVAPPPPSTIPAATPIPLPFTIGFTAAELQAPGGAAPTTPSSDSGLSPSFDTVDDFAGTGDSFFATPDIPTPQEQAIAAPAQAEGRFPTRTTAGRVDGEGVDQPWGRLPLLALAAAAIGAGTVFAKQRLRDLGWVGAT